LKRWKGKRTYKEFYNDLYLKYGYKCEQVGVIVLGFRDICNFNEFAYSKYDFRLAILISKTAYN
jgi:hypothetical protein